MEIIEELEDESNQFFDNQMKSFVTASVVNEVLNLKDYWVEEHNFFNGINSIDDDVDDGQE